MTHVLGRVTFEIDLPAGQMANPVQDRLSRYVAQVLPTLLEEELAGQSWRHARLVIDLGTVPLPRLEEEASDRIRAELRGLGRLAQGSGTAMGAGTANEAATRAAALPQDGTQQTTPPDRTKGPDPSGGALQETALTNRMAPGTPPAPHMAGAQDPPDSYAHGRANGQVADPGTDLSAGMATDLATDLAHVLRGNMARHLILGTAPLGRIVTDTALAMSAPALRDWLRKVCQTHAGRAGLAAAVSSDGLQRIMAHAAPALEPAGQQPLPDHEALRLRAGIGRQAFGTLWRQAALDLVAQGWPALSHSAFGAHLKRVLTRHMSRTAQLNPPLPSPMHEGRFTAQNPSQRSAPPAIQTDPAPSPDAPDSAPDAGKSAALADAFLAALLQGYAAAPTAGNVRHMTPARAFDLAYGQAPLALARALRGAAEQPLLTTALIDRLPPAQLLALLRLMLPVALAARMEKGLRDPAQPQLPKTDTGQVGQDTAQATKTRGTAAKRALWHAVLGLALRPAAHGDTCKHMPEEVWTSLLRRAADRLQNASARPDQPHWPAPDLASDLAQTDAPDFATGNGTVSATARLAQRLRYGTGAATRADLLQCMAQGAAGIAATGHTASTQQVLLAALHDPVARRRLLPLLQPADWPQLARAINADRTAEGLTRNLRSALDAVAARPAPSGATGPDGGTDPAPLRAPLGLALMQVIAARATGISTHPDADTDPDKVPGVVMPGQHDNASGVAGTDDAENMKIEVIHHAAQHIADANAVTRVQALDRLRPLFPAPGDRKLIDRHAAFWREVSEASNPAAPDRMQPPRQASNNSDEQAGAGTAAPFDPGGAPPQRPNAQPDATPTWPDPQDAPAQQPVRFHSAVAGLALLWPFMERFLSALDLLQQGQFSGPPAQARAAHLLHHLATGAPLPVQDDLALPNLLCGLRPAHPTPPAEPLTEAEAGLAAELLSSVCQMWPGLENTSIQGLRGSFLTRGGLLDLPADGPAQLRIETRGFDMLLDRVPWPLGMVGLGWMARPLAVDWGRP